MAEIEIYTRQLCGYCMLAKSLLESRNVAFKEYDATFDPAMRREMIGRANGSSTFPQVFINGNHVGGCTELQALDRSGKLDGLLATEPPQ
jgi:glutaredoxin 3